MIINYDPKHLYYRPLALLGHTRLDREIMVETNVLAYSVTPSATNEKVFMSSSPAPRRKCFPAAVGRRRRRSCTSHTCRKVLTKMFFFRRRESKL